MLWAFMQDWHKAAWIQGGVSPSTRSASTRVKSAVVCWRLYLEDPSPEKGKNIELDWPQKEQRDFRANLTSLSGTAWSWGEEEEAA